MIFLDIIFCFFAFVIIWAMVGYGISLKIIKRFSTGKELVRDLEYQPMVSVIIVAHNEEKVIWDKLNNIIDNNYPESRIEYIITSDFSTDKTNELVEVFIRENVQVKMYLHKTKLHRGKTNAQNEAQKLAKGEILVMTDANSMFESNAISELVSTFASEDVVYVTGRLKYRNAEESSTSETESLYWESDLLQREVESNIKTITAGNGAIYACQNERYYDFPDIECHDSAMPYYYGKRGFRCLYNPSAIAYEKAGETDRDEFKRKVRMNRTILNDIKNGVAVMNPVKYGWFSYFYFGHRTCRYLLWLAHIGLFLCNIGLCFHMKFYWFTMIFQVLFWSIGVIGNITIIKNKAIKKIAYYTLTIFAQLCAVKKCLTGNGTATWESAKSTR